MRAITEMTKTIVIAAFKGAKFFDSKSKDSVCFLTAIVNKNKFVLILI